MCDICGKGNSKLVHKGTRDNRNIDVYECDFCHTKFLGEIKENDYKNGFMNGIHRMTPQQIQNRLNACKKDDERRAIALKKYCKDKRILDFGCGFGGYLDLIKEVTPDIFGVEVGDSETEYLKSKNFNIKTDINEYSEPFDVITLFHVLEHLPEPQKWLDTFAKHLKSGGLLFLEVPNGNDALLNLYKSDKFADFTYWSAHLYLYTVKSLKLLIKQNGQYKIEKAEQVQRYPLSNHLYWIKEGKPEGHKKLTYLNNKLINTFYTKFLSAANMCDTLFFILRKI